MTCLQFGAVLNCRVGVAPGFDKQYAVVQFFSFHDAESAIHSLTELGWLIRHAHRPHRLWPRSASGSASNQRGRTDIHAQYSAGRQHRISSRDISGVFQVGDVSASPVRVASRPHVSGPWRQRLGTWSHRSISAHKVPVGTDSDEDPMFHAKL